MRSTKSRPPSPISKAPFSGRSGEAGRRENASRNRWQSHKTHHDVLSKKFDEMLKIAKENPDEPPPKRDIDFD